MQIERKRAFVFDIEKIINDFALLLDSLKCPACVTLPDQVIVTAVFNKLLGYSEHRGTAYHRIMNELQVFGLPPLVAEDLFQRLCLVVGERVKSVSKCDLFYTEFYYKFVDDTTVVILEH